MNLMYFQPRCSRFFYVNDLNILGWKVVLHKELRSKRILVSDSDEVTMLDNLIGVDVPLEIPKVQKNMALIGAIELIGADAILTTKELQRPSSDDEIGFE